MSTYKLHYDITLENEKHLDLPDVEDLPLNKAVTFIKNSAMNTGELASSWKITIERTSK